MTIPLPHSWPVAAVLIALILGFFYGLGQVAKKNAGDAGIVLVLLIFAGCQILSR